MSLTRRHIITLFASTAMLLGASTVWSEDLPKVALKIGRAHV